ncbi:MAG: Hsp70 family protein [Deinococcus sp.]|nr:Hsp70 family protein [Deinococcus sp.]
MSGIVIAPSHYLLGIDLGTSYSLVAAFDGLGEPVVLEIDGTKEVPSVVSFSEGHRYLVGQKAKRLARIAPDRTVSSIKLKLKDPHYRLETLGQAYTPADISALILGYLRDGAQRSTAADWRGNLTRCVISVPANFGPAEREQVVRAGQLAGLEVIGLINEPTAAAIAYGFDRVNEDSRLLIYDMGGGTLDVSVVKVRSRPGKANELRVLASNGLDVGGDNFDELILRHLADKLQAGTGIQLLDLTAKDHLEIDKKRELQALFRSEAERMKRELSESEHTVTWLPNLLDTSAYPGVSFDAELFRSQFEPMIQPLVQATEEVINKSLAQAKLSREQIDKAVLVGGSTHIPLVRRFVAEVMGRAPYGDLDPSTCVALGAALYAYALTVPGEEPPLVDINSYSFGIQASGWGFTELIPKGAELPGEYTKTFTTVADEVTFLNINVYSNEQGNRRVTDPGMKLLGQFTIDGLPPRKAGEVKVEVTFRLNEDNILEVSARLPGRADSEAGITIGKR